MISSQISFCAIQSRAWLSEVIILKINELSSSPIYDRWQIDLNQSTIHMMGQFEKSIINSIQIQTSAGDCEIFFQCN